MCTPDLDDILELSGLAAIASCNRRNDGSSRSLTPVAAAIYIAVGKVSFEDCDMFTWSLG